MLRYLRLVGIQIRVAITTLAQYRLDFLVKGALATFWIGVSLIPLMAVFEQRPRVAGWTYPEALVVVGWFTLLKAVLEGSVTPSLTAVVEGVRTGALDFVLLKPADSQFLVSTAKFEPWRLVDVMGAVAIFVWAFRTLGRWPSPRGLLVAGVLLLVALMLLYSLWILVVSASFWVVRVDNLSYLLSSIFDAARWPVTVFPRMLQIVFTFVFPLALMTTMPAEAMLGRLDARTAVYASAGGLAFAALARAVWKRAIRAYTSASS